jgi:hypothetical protein
VAIGESILNLAANTAKGVLNNTFGNVKQAVILLDDKRKVMENPKSETNSSAEALSKLGGMLTGAYDKFNLTFSNVTNIVDTDSQSSEAVRKSFYVQFNPNELKINAKSGAMIRKLSLDGNKRSYNLRPEPTRIELSVRLTFDKVNQINLNMLASRAVNAVGAAETVQTEAEGFIAAVRNPNTRSITFAWGNFMFKGSLVNINAEYTMFGASGVPLRAYVDMTIFSLQDKKAQDIFKYDLEQEFKL